MALIRKKAIDHSVDPHVILRALDCHKHVQTSTMVVNTVEEKISKLLNREGVASTPFLSCHKIRIPPSMPCFFARNVGVVHYLGDRSQTSSAISGWTLTQTWQSLRTRTKRCLPSLNSLRTCGSWRKPRWHGISVGGYDLSSQSELVGVTPMGHCLILSNIDIIT